MIQKNKVMRPKFFYDKTNKPVAVYLTIEDYTAFMNRLKKFSDEMRQEAKSRKQSATKKHK